MIPITLISCLKIAVLVASLTIVVKLTSSMYDAVKNLILKK